MLTNGVSCLLMGGQACVLYGAAEFSRDTDLAISAGVANLNALKAALNELGAECIAVPPFEREYLQAGLAVHFRCHHPEAAGMRIDVMSKMRGLGEFSELWARRTTVETGDAVIDILSLPDLVRAKKTQRDKDWVMIVRLLEAHYFSNQQSPTAEQVAFWLLELRTPSLLLDLANRFPDACRQMAHRRPLLTEALSGRGTSLEAQLRHEEAVERQADRVYWEPLKRELERLRGEQRTGNL